MDAQQQEAQGLPPVVLPFQVGTFMGQHMASVFRSHGRGQINFGAQNAQNEGRPKGITNINALFRFQRNADLSADVKVSNRGVNQQENNAEAPDVRRMSQDEHPDVVLRNGAGGLYRSVKGGDCHINKSLSWFGYPVLCDLCWLCVDCKDITRLRVGEQGLLPLDGNGLGVGNQAKAAFQRKRTE